MGKTRERGPAGPEIAYLISKYPNRSSIFVVRDLLELERSGYRLHIYSLNRPPVDQECPEHARVRAEVTYLPEWERGELLRTVADHFWCLVKYPIRYLKVWAHVVRSRDFRYAKMLISSPSLARALIARPSVGHLHAYFADKEASVALIVHWLTGLPFSFAAHSFDVFRSPRVLPDKVREATFVVAISDFNRQVIIGRCGSDIADKVDVVRCGLDLRQFEDIREGRRRAVNQRGRRPFSILTVARLSPKKGHQNLIEALALLRQRGREFRWLVVGDGPLREVLREKVRACGLADWVQFTGQVINARVRELLRDADCFVLSSVWIEGREVDGIPVVLMEAMAAGVPVVSTPISGIPELVTDGVSGLLVEPKNSEALADAIQSLMDDASLRERLASAAWKRVAEEFEIARNIDRLKSLFGDRYASNKLR